MGFKWDVAPTDVFPQMATLYTQATLQGARRVAYTRAPEMTAYAKANHAWQNVTGAAEAGLHDTVEESGSSIILTLAHGDDVRHGIWLEVANGGRYGIIPQTIDVFGPLIMGDLQRLVRR